MANEIRLEGFDEFKKKLAGLPGRSRIAIDAIVQDEAKRWEGLAKRSAPRNKIVGLGGRLLGGIISRKIADYSAEVTVNTRYSPYVEFGTGTKVSVPADLIKYALQFKGSRKVIGMAAQPYLFVHKLAVETSLKTRVQNYLNKQQ